MLNSGSDLRLDVGQLESGQQIERLDVIETSSLTGFGLDGLMIHIAATLRRDAGDSVVGSTVQRASASLTEAAEALSAAIGAAENQWATRSWLPRFVNHLTHSAKSSALFIRMIFLISCSGGFVLGSSCRTEFIPFLAGWIAA